jgi:type II secretory pathway pseudopilin PulG
MSPSSRALRALRARRGFSLVEATISLTLLIIVMVVSMTLLFSMRSFAERQQLVMAPRQTARRAADYLSFYLAGATDLNQSSVQPSPNALIMYFNSSAADPASVAQASYNNLTGAEAGNAVSGGTTNFGDPGTDIISVAIPNQPAAYAIMMGVFPADGANVNIFIGFRGGCGGPGGTDDAGNEAAFETLVGITGTQPVSSLMSIIDKDGRWIYTRLTGIQSNCSSPIAQFIQATINPGQAPGSGGTIDPPFGHGALSAPTNLVVGLQYVSFRVRNGNLQQKTGFPFDPATDNPGTAFATVMENVEDLQFAYMFSDGTLWNTAQQVVHKAAGLCTEDRCDNGVPFQAGPIAVAADSLDITRCVGVRATVIARSPPLPIGSRKLTNFATTGLAGNHFRPAAEDHALVSNPPSQDNFDHYRVTTTIMLRNRMLGG